MFIPWLGTITIGWRDIVDVLLVTLLLYRIILLVKGTRAVAAIYGLFIVIIFFAATLPLGFNTLSWILGTFLNSLFLVVIIVFQRDIRMALTYVGSGRHFFSSRKKHNEELIEEVAAAALYMAQRNIGALIVIEGNVPLGDMAQGGVNLNARISKELLISIFWHGGPLHDGAVILRGKTLAEAGCILPLTTMVQGKQDYGTRHRAALGITEETDAIAVVVSEERGAVSVSLHGRLSAPLDAARLRRVLGSALEKHA